MNKKRIAVIWIGITILVPLMALCLPHIIRFSEATAISQEVDALEQEKSAILSNNEYAQKRDRFVEISVSIERKENQIKAVSQKAIVFSIFLLMGVSFFSVGIFLTGNK